MAPAAGDPGPGLASIRPVRPPLTELSTSIGDKRDGRPSFYMTGRFRGGRPGRPGRSRSLARWRTSTVRFACAMDAPARGALDLDCPGAVDPSARAQLVRRERSRSLRRARSYPDPRPAPARSGGAVESSLRGDSSSASTAMRWDLADASNVLPIARHVGSTPRARGRPRGGSRHDDELLCLGLGAHPATTSDWLRQFTHQPLALLVDESNPDSRDRWWTRAMRPGPDDRRPRCRSTGWRRRSPGAGPPGRPQSAILLDGPGVLDLVPPPGCRPHFGVEIRTGIVLLRRQPARSSTLGPLRRR